MKKMLMITTILFAISCSKLNTIPNEIVDYSRVNNTKTTVSVDDNNVKESLKVVKNVESTDDFRKQKINDAILKVKINDKDIKIIYITDRGIFEKIKKVFEGKNNVGIFFQSKIPHLGCVDGEYDVIFLTSDMQVASNGLGNNLNGKCSTVMIKNILLLPKHLIDVNILNIGDVLNLDFSGKIPLNTKMIQ